MFRITGPCYLSELGTGEIIEDGPNRDHVPYLLPAGQDKLFSKEDMLVDPTGIATWCQGPKDQTEGGSLARRGFYVFKREDGILVAVSYAHVTYVD